MSLLNFYDKNRTAITSSKTFFKTVLKNDISRCAKKAQNSFLKGYLTMLEEHLSIDMHQPRQGSSIRRVAKGLKINRRGVFIDVALFKARHGGA